MALIQTIYTSRPFGYDGASLAGILLDARRCNSRDGITGALLCRHDLYLQLLEGPAEQVDACLARIKADDRHLEVDVKLRREVETRMFPNWAMHHDPANTLMWSTAEVEDGAAARARADEVLAMFDALSRSVPAALQA